MLFGERFPDKQQTAGAQQDVDIGERGRSVVGVKYMHGAQLTVMCPHGVPVGFQVLAQGTEGAFHACDIFAPHTAVGRSMIQARDTWVEKILGD